MTTRLAGCLLLIAIVMGFAVQPNHAHATGWKITRFGASYASATATTSGAQDTFTVRSSSKLIQELTEIERQNLAWDTPPPSLLFGKADARFIGHRTDPSATSAALGLQLAITSQTVVIDVLLIAIREGVSKLIPVPSPIVKFLADPAAIVPLVHRLVADFRGFTDAVGEALASGNWSAVPAALGGAVKASAGTLVDFFTRDLINAFRKFLSGPEVARFIASLGTELAKFAVPVLGTAKLVLWVGGILLAALPFASALIDAVNGKGGPTNLRFAWNVAGSSPTATLRPPTATATSRPAVATATSRPATATVTSSPAPGGAASVVPTATWTAPPPTATLTALPPTATNTPLPPTATFTPTATQPAPPATGSLTVDLITRCVGSRCAILDIYPVRRICLIGPADPCQEVAGSNLRAVFRNLPVGNYTVFLAEGGGCPQDVTRLGATVPSVGVVTLRATYALDGGACTGW